MELRKIVGLNLARYLSASGISHAEFGRAMKPYVGKEWSRQQVGQATNGLRAFSIDDLVAVALALRVPPVALLELPPAETHFDLNGKTYARQDIENPRWYGDSTIEALQKLSDVAHGIHAQIKDALHAAWPLEDLSAEVSNAAALLATRLRYERLENSPEQTG